MRFKRTETLHRSIPHACGDDWRNYQVVYWLSRQRTNRRPRRTDTSSSRDWGAVISQQLLQPPAVDVSRRESPGLRRSESRLPGQIKSRPLMPIRSANDQVYILSCAPAAHRRIARELKEGDGPRLVPSAPADGVLAGDERLVVDGSYPQSRTDHIPVQDGSYLQSRTDHIQVNNI